MNRERPNLYALNKYRRGLEEAEWYRKNSHALSVRLDNSARQAISLTAVAIATGYVREDPFRIGGIRLVSGFYFILGAGLRGQLMTLLGFAAVTRSSPFGTKCNKLE
ncbi:hypothetical protein AVEN_171716-1 [Araneus ventricosus]|uniref:Uncharacterized protein n=1 Tax=Araneus ventricosus TaxID=182803 RepID=A0A4Y2M233_ARAVE|nr:hypothetical protein AVEN_171716-1 [Araneus ventricosus]